MLSRRILSSLLLACAVVAWPDNSGRAAEDHEHADRIDPFASPVPSAPDWAEPPGATPSVSTPYLRSFGPVAPAARQPAGALSGRIVFMNSGHGWTFDPDYWRLQRGTTFEMNEDYGNLDQLNFFAAWCFNAGATVVSLRPLGQQTNEVVLDNDDPGVTFAGTWFDSVSTTYFGSPGDVPYRYAALAANAESASATYTPVIPVEGYYPVYTWVLHGSDRGDQLYRIRHTGGESQVRVPHHMVGSGWVYLGEYYFNAGSNAAAGSVIVSNLRGSATGTYAFADAIRFGNGMGSVNRGGGVSGYPREEENCRYWIQANLGQGQAASLYDGSGNDESDSWSAPPKMSAAMNREQSGNLHKRIHVSFHSNAAGGGARGALALITSDPTPNQATLAQLAGQEVNSQLVAVGSPPLEFPWSTRSPTYTGGYSEITGSLFNYEMDATIIEVGFHDNATDAALLRDPKCRSAIGRAALHAVLKYMNQFDGLPLTLPPDPPRDLRARGASDGSITLRWLAPAASSLSGAPTGYVVYRSANGRGFGNPVLLSNVTEHTLTGLTAGVDHYFRVAAINAGGESMPSAVVGCRAPAGPAAPRVLVVNAFDRYERGLNLRQNTTRQAWAPPGSVGTIERVLPRRNNAFDYVVPHGRAISAFGLSFDSCPSAAVASGAVPLGDYRVVIWACGQESTAQESFSATEQTLVGAYRDAGGHLFVSGSEIAWDLDRASGPSAGDRAFLNTHLKADLGADANDNSGSHAVNAAAGGVFDGRGGASFDNGSGGLYWVRSPDMLTPVGPGARPALQYAANNATAAVQYDGSAGGGRVIYLGFPFETLTNPATRQIYMADALGFLTAGTATLVGVGSVWKYHDTGADLGTAWREPAYNDAAWPAGPAELGFGDGDEATVIDGNRQRITTYFRSTFAVPGAGEFQALTLRLKRDDGAVAYLNGVEVYRGNLPAGGITATTSALAAVGGAEESAWFSVPVDLALLAAGTNWLAVELHQNGTNSSDLSFDLELLAALRPPVALTLIPAGATWRYVDNGIAQGTSWRLHGYNDAGWKAGAGKFGFGGDGEVTVLNRTNAGGSTNITFYFRRPFYVPNPLAVQSLVGRMIRDDGVVVYLNGTEAWRDNLPAGSVTHGTFALAAIGGTDENAWLESGLSPAYLIPGWNVLAAEVHQAALTSSDAGFNFELQALVTLAPPPPLTLRDGALAWPGEGAFSAVEMATSLAPSVSWTLLPGVPTWDGSSWILPIPPATNQQRFFRLRSP